MAVKKNTVAQTLGTGRRKSSVARVRLVKGTGKVVINDGKFEYTGPQSDVIAKDGDLFLLNSNNTNKGTITVNGGTFKNHAPSYEPVGSDAEVVLGTGKHVYNGTTVVNTAHTGDTEVWYTVK